MKTAVFAKGIVNIPVLAEGVRKRNERENIALEDIQQLILTIAQQHGAAIEFDCMSGCVGETVSPNGAKGC